MKLPMSSNLTLPQEAVFTCELKNAENIIWTINGTDHTQHLPPNVMVHNHGSTSVLRFSSCINNTAVECRASYDFGLSETSPSVSMKCQGVLPPSLSLSLSSSLPPSLSLPVFLSRTLSFSFSHLLTLELCLYLLPHRAAWCHS